MNDDEIRKRLVAAVERSITSTLYGTSTTGVAAEPQEPLTLAKLQKMMAGLPKPDVWLSTRLFPCSDAIVVEGASERFTVAHPSLWLRLEDRLRRSEKVEVVTGPPSIFAMNLTPIEIDPWPDDSPETAAWRAGYWKRLREAILVAMTPLPEWLRSPPKFGERG
jgi:hypothetical protein